MNVPSAIAVLEMSSIPVGTMVADTMIKRAPITVLRIGTVQPGKYIILIGGSVASVEESHLEGLRRAGDALIDEIMLADVHPQVYESIEGVRRPDLGDALGVIETTSIPTNIRAADRAIKAADVNIVEIRLGDGLGGKGTTHFVGTVENVETAIAAGIESNTNGRVAIQSVVIPNQDGGLRERIDETTSLFG